MTDLPRRRWVCAPWDEAAQRPLIDELGVKPILAQLLINRSILDPDDARQFLSPKLADIPNPFLLPDMDAACERVIAAIKRKEPMVIYGDYDVDGTSAAAILTEFLLFYGANVSPYLPDREKDGYGLQPEPLKRLVAQGARLVITCDNGTSSHEAIDWAATQGVDVVITDHHSLPDPIPNAVAVVNPLRSPGSPWDHVCGAGLAFALALALRKKLREGGERNHPNLREALDLVTLGTIADVVPLVGVNRTLVWHGLRELRQRRRPGLAALLTVSGVSQTETINAQTVGFRLGPRLNAAGRVASAATAVDLMVCKDPNEARRLAGQLEDYNQARRRIEEKVLAEVWAQLAAQGDERPDRDGYVLAGEGWHPGVIGIVAARVVDATQRPAFVIALNDGVGKGSGRSVPGVDLYQALLGSDELLQRYGGHPMAAGLTMDAARVSELRQRFEQACSEQIGGGGYEPQLLVDAWLPAEKIQDDLVTDIASLGPFGPKNPEPVFATRHVSVVDRREVGKGHLKIRLRGGRRHYGAIGFRMAELQSRIPGDGGVAVAHSLEFNHWQGRTSIQLRLKDLVSAAALASDGETGP